MSEQVTVQIPMPMVERVVRFDSTSKKGRQAIEEFVMDQKRQGKRLLEMGLHEDGRRILIILQASFKLSWEDGEHLVVTYRSGQRYSTKE